MIAVNERTDFGAGQLSMDMENNDYLMAPFEAFCTRKVIQDNLVLDSRLWIPDSNH